MGRRIEVELTSTRDDGSWTWRAAGAKQPKGDLDGSLLYDGASVGDVVKVEAEFHLDGIEITEVFAPKAKKERSNLLEMKSRPLRDDELVTTQRVARNDRRGDRGDRGERRGGRGRSRGEGRGDRDGQRRGPRPEPERRQKPKRLRPKRTHRDALLAEVTEEHRPIVEQVLRDGMPGVRSAIEKQNADAKAAGKPEIDPSPIIAIAEKNLGPARLAEWRDRADAALADGAELDIRDLRSVVVAGSDIARNDETRALVEQVKTLLDQRLESDHTAWLQDLDAAVQEGRVVRGLRLSSRPVKAGAPLPTEVASKLAEQASQALAADVAQDRWATVLDALAFSPVRGAVTPAGLPVEPGEELLSEVRRLSDRIPAIANLFGIDPAAVPKSAKRRRSPRRDGGNRGGRAPARGSTKPDRPVPGAEPKPEPVKDQQLDKAPGEPASPETEATGEESTDATATTETSAAPTPEESTGTEAPTTSEARTETATDEAPAADEAPATDDAPAADEAPATDDAPATDEAPVTDESPEAAPAEAAAQADEPAPAGETETANEAPTDQPAPAGETETANQAPTDEPEPAGETETVDAGPASEPAEGAVGNGTASGGDISEGDEADRAGAEPAADEPAVQETS